MKATCVSKPEKQDSIDFCFLFFFNSVFIVHLLKSSQSHGLDYDLSTLTLLTFGAG